MLLFGGRGPRKACIFFGLPSLRLCPLFEQGIRVGTRQTASALAANIARVGGLAFGAEPAAALVAVLVADIGKGFGNIAAEEHQHLFCQFLRAVQLLAHLPHLGGGGVALFEGIPARLGVMRVGLRALDFLFLLCLAVFALLVLGRGKDIGKCAFQIRNKGATVDNALLVAELVG